ncbi:hypothetical protein J7I94_13970 [Streptomyces sp. ISL-12]|uniref:hypothetical protein n=1 Tax=Streptomyces sp. ISL-12 TaxID=2819177 RepID=UPI001BE5959E|nr:hypothetical protein [Streptomyces sp. ISL-12]MBT2411660.1 hypothetical protein [Streptomyces sp. ISL-12]
MDIFVIVIALLAVIAAGAFLIHRLNSQHGDRAAAFHYRRDGVVEPGQEPRAGQTARRRPGEVNGGGRRWDHRDGGRVRLRPRRRTPKKPA